MALGLPAVLSEAPRLLARVAAPVQPVEIAGALQRECDNNATIWNRDRTV
ncbi:FhaA domain-containing protein, partial [Streptomyces sp. NPDC001833]